MEISMLAPTVIKINLSISPAPYAIVAEVQPLVLWCTMATYKCNIDISGKRERGETEDDMERHGEERKLKDWAGWEMHKIERSGELV